MASFFRILLQMSENRMAITDGPMTFGYAIDAIDSACKNQRYENKHLPKGAAVKMMIDRSAPLAWKNLHEGRHLFDVAVRSYEDA
jgi:hypothetical protein